MSDKKKYVIYTNNTKYVGYFTGERYAVTVFRSKFGRDGVIYHVVDDIKKAKVYTTKRVNEIAKNMSENDWYEKHFTVYVLDSDGVSKINRKGN